MNIQVTKESLNILLTTTCDENVEGTVQNFEDGSADFVGTALSDEASKEKLVRLGGGHLGR